MKKPPPKPVKKRPLPPKTVTMGEHAACMDPPNHNKPLLTSKLSPYPLLHLEVVDDEGRQYNPFVLAEYGSDYLALHDKPRSPPTWMDPHLFVNLAAEDPRIKELIDKGIKRDLFDPAVKQIAHEMERIVEDYIVFLIEQMPRVAPLLAQWLLLHVAEVRAQKARDKK